jgi:S-adenosylmethionine uptake transporter
MFDWFFRTGFPQGIFWAVSIYFMSTVNDVWAKLLGDRLHFVEISFFRFLFSTLTVVMLMLKSKNNLFKTSIHGQHAMRGILGAVALALCCYSVNIMPLAENTIILFSEALFMIPLTVMFLNERILTKTIVATSIGCLGVIVMYRPTAQILNLTAIVPTLAAALFAIMNIMIKKMVDTKEHTLTMLFYFGLYTTIISGAFVSFFWKSPTLYELFMLVMLGLGANLIQLFGFCAYRATSASSISPVRFIELPFSILFGFVFFGQIPDFTALLGALFIICGTLVAYRGSSS